ncbi:MAG: hypothetical protein PSV18_10405 [Methylobacter sp.]|nr:hypothetical protein [Candidatus Methylobacter titanis]
MRLYLRLGGTGLDSHAAGLAATLPDNCELFYAVKANSDLPILQTLAPHVRGFEVASDGELAWVRSHFPDIPVIFGGPGKLDTELATRLGARRGIAARRKFGRVAAARLAGPK